MNVNGHTKYEQDPLNIVGCRVVTRAGSMDGQMDGWTDRQMAQGMTISYGPRVKMMDKILGCECIFIRWTVMYNRRMNVDH